MLDKKSWDTPYVQYTLLSHMHGHLENADDSQGKATPSVRLSLTLIYALRLTDKPVGSEPTIPCSSQGERTNDLVVE